VNNDWDLVDLRVFCSVARRSSFNAAATELGISPAYVSKRIADLERALGATLFRRATRRVHITDEGALASPGRAVLDAAGLTGSRGAKGSLRSRHQYQHAVGPNRLTRAVPPQEGISCWSSGWNWWIVASISSARLRHRYPDGR
jgi:DNA-binding transcriptional LysR family regulator